MRYFALALCWLICCSAAQAQFKPYDPYADSNEDLIPVGPDGQLNWPTFFKDAALHSKFKVYSAWGSCRGSNMRIVNQLEANKVDINKLPEISITGNAVNLQDGVLTIVKDQQQTQVVTHPQGVSKVEVTGKMQISALRPGLFVRVATVVNDKGQGQEKLSAIEVFSPDEKFVSTSPVTGKLENLAGQLKLMKDHQLHIDIAAPGKIRKLMLPVTAETIVHVNGNTLDLAGPQDEVTAKGRQYVIPGTKQQVLFVSEVTVSKELPGTKAADKTASK